MYKKKTKLRVKQQFEHSISDVFEISVIILSYNRSKQKKCIAYTIVSTHSNEAKTRISQRQKFVKVGSTAAVQDDDFENENTHTPQIQTQ